MIRGVVRQRFLLYAEFLEKFFLKFAFEKYIDGDWSS